MLILFFFIKLLLIFESVTIQVCLNREFNKIVFLLFAFTEFKNDRMSLMPLLFSEWLENLDRPHDLFGQHFGLPLQVEDLVDRITPSRSELMIYKPNRLTSNRYHPFLHGLSKKRSKGTSTISANKDNFQVTLDVHHFEPEEINVKVVDKSIVVEAKHEEKQVMCIIN